MAKEFKSLTVSPASEQYTIDVRSIFGWELQSSQEINSKESHIESGFTSNYSVTTTENYVKLVFSRDPAQVEHYQELVQLEREYDSVPEPGDEPVFGKILFVFLLFMYIVPGILYAVSYSRKKKKYMARLSEYLDKREDIVNRARAVIGSNATA